MSITPLTQGVIALCGWICSSALFASTATPCDEFASHFDQFPYLEQLRTEQHAFTWRGLYFSGCRVLQTTHHQLVQITTPQALIPKGWVIGQERSSLYVLDHPSEPNFCLLQLTEEDYQYWQLECALRPLAW